LEKRHEEKQQYRYGWCQYVSSAIKASVDDGLLHPDPVHDVTKHLLQGIESDHFRVKKTMPRIGGFQSFNTA